MIPFFVRLIGVFIVVVASNASAAIHYVDLASTNALPPYTSWDTAATNVQDAIDVADPGDDVLVTNGIYEVGGRALIPGALTNRIAVTKPLTLRSVNGAAVTIIRGYQVPGTIYGTNAVRCAYLMNGVLLDGFTLTNGATYSSGGSDVSGGGVYCKSTNATIVNCVLTGSATSGSGGGVYLGTLSNCVIQGNTAFTGGGAYFSAITDSELKDNAASFAGGGAYSSVIVNSRIENNSTASNDGGGSYGSLSTLVNCILTGNKAGRDGGGSAMGTLINCAIYGNRAEGNGGGVAGGTLSNCTVVANSAPIGVGGGASSAALRNCILYNNTAVGSSSNYSNAQLFNSFTTDPQLASLTHLSSTSPCRNAGDPAFASGTDIDGESWANPPSLGCDQFNEGTITGALSVVIGAAYTNIAAGYETRFTALIDGRVNGSQWEFDDGTIISNQPVIARQWAAPGSYPLKLTAFNETYPGGIATTTLVQVVAQPVHYVKLGNFFQASPYTNWTTAAANIQSAVNAASVPGSLVLVSNGLYNTGTMTTYGNSSRVAVTNPVLVKSLNGPAVTTIAGIRSGATVRGVFLIDGAGLSGFTVTNGGTSLGSGGIPLAVQVGGGVLCESSRSTVSNCVFLYNFAPYGAGVFGGSVNNCLMTTNYGGGAAAYASLNSCIIRSNDYVGIYGGTAYNCLVISNRSYGSLIATVVNCTIVGNGGGGAADSAASNCVVYYNSVANFVDDPNYQMPPAENNCCTLWPLFFTPNGSGNFTNAPVFVNAAAGDFHLQSDSPCVNDGLNVFVFGATDLDGNPRIVSSAVDVGAYECQNPASQISHVWLWQYGLPMDGSGDYADADADGANNWQEWIAGTTPTNAASLLKLNAPRMISSGFRINWQSVANRTYFLQRATDLVTPSPFSTLQSNIVGQINSTTFIDSSATNGGAYFYRVGVQ